MSAAINSSYKLRGIVTLLFRYRISSSPSPYYAHNRGFLSSSSKFGYGSSYMNQGLRFINSNTSNSQGDGKPNFDRAKWLVGAVLSLLFPFWKQKWESLQGLEGKVEKVVEEVEMVADVVEKVATVTEKVSAEVAQQFPENDIIKTAAMAVEHISSVTAADAHLTKDFIHKVDDVNQDLKDLETMVEPVIGKIIAVENHKQ